MEKSWLSPLRYLLSGIRSPIFIVVLALLFMPLDPVGLLLRWLWPDLFPAKTATSGSSSPGMTSTRSAADWIQAPWSTLQGKARPTPPPAPEGPFPDYPTISFPTIDSGFPSSFHFTNDENLWWLDKHRVVFKGIEQGSYDAEWDKRSDKEQIAVGRKRGMLVGHYIWDTQNNTFTLYRRSIYNFCLEDGVITYVEEPEKEGVTGTVWSGPLGKEAPRPDIKPSDLPNNRHGSRVRCSYRREDAGSSLNRGWGSFRTNVADGYLQYVTKSNKIVPLPILASEFGGPYYAPWQDRYLLTEAYARGFRMAGRWWLSRDGTIEAVDIPKTPYITAVFEPVRPGILMVGEYRPDMKTMPDAPQTYLIAPDGTFKGVSGFILGYNHSVSPDGCKGATIRGGRGLNCGQESNADLAAGGKGCRTIHLINYCPEEQDK